MDHLTGSEEVGSGSLQQSVNQGEFARLPMQQQLDLAGDRLGIELIPKHQFALDARQHPEALARASQSPVRRLLKKISSKIHHQRSIEILKVTHLCQQDRQNFVDGWIAVYQRGDRILGSNLELNGWLVSRNSKATSIQITNNSVLVAEAPIQIPRPDVLKVIPHHSSNCNFGYQVVLDIEDLSDALPLTLYAVLQDERRILTGEIQFCKYGF